MAFDLQLIHEFANKYMYSPTSHFSKVLLTPMQEQPGAGCPASAGPAAGKAFSWGRLRSGQEQALCWLIVACHILQTTL